MVNDTRDCTSNFTGRQWVFDEITCWLQQKDQRFFLLTGEPGAGKSAISDRLSQFSSSTDPIHPNLLPGFLSAVHHCSARDSTTVDPKNFAQAIALQLAQHIPPFAQALKDSGEKQVNIQVDLSVETANDSTIQAVVIQNLNLAGVMTAQEAFNGVVLQPLHTLYRTGFDQPITILVDALDEALTHSGDRTIVDLLSSLERLPPQVRFILTSRKEVQVENKFADAEILDLSAPAFHALNQSDIQAYIQTRLAQEERLSAVVSPLDSTQQTAAITQITEKAEGNFLYVRFLLDGIERGERSLTDLEGLPNGLEALYYQSLERVVNLEQWRATAAVFMGILSVVRTSLTLRQLQAFTERSESVTHQCLLDLRQFLEEVASHGEQTEEEPHYRLYHQSVVDFLRKRSFKLGDHTRHNPYYLPAQESHQRIANHYWKTSQSLEAVDRYHLDSYAYNHLAYHLLESDRKDELYNLLVASPNWMQTKFIACKGDAAYVADLELAIGSFADPLQPQQLLFLIQLHTARRVVRQRSEPYYSGSLANALIWLGREAEVLSYARLSNDLGRKYASLANTYKTLREVGRADFALLEEVWQAAQAIEDDSHRVLALGDTAVELASVNELAKANEAFAQARETAEQDRPTDKGQNKTRALIRLAECFCRSTCNEHREQAKDIYALAHKTAQQMQDCQKQALLPFDSALAPLKDLQWQVMLLCELSSSLWQMNFQQESTATLTEAQEIAEITGQAVDKLKHRAAELKQTQVSWEDVTPETYQIENFLKTEYQNGAQISLVQTLAIMQRLEEAEQASKKIDADREPYWVFSSIIQNIVSAWIQNKQFTKAEALARGLSVPSERIKVLGDVASALAQAVEEDNTKSAEIFTELWEVFENQVEGKHQKDLSLSYIAQALAKAGHFDAAEQAALRIQEQQQQSAALVTLIQSLIQAMYLTESDRFKRIERITDSIQESQHKVEALAKQCVALARAGRRDEAERALAQARSVPQTTIALTDFVGITCEIAKIVAQSGNTQEADAMFELAKTSVEAITDHFGQSWATFLLATNLAQSNHFSEKAESAAKQIYEPNWRAEVLRELVIALSTQKHFVEAERIANEIEDSRLQIDALSQLSIAYYKVRHEDKGNEAKINTLMSLLKSRAKTAQELKVLVKTLSQVNCCKEAERIAHSIQEPLRQEEALTDVAIALIQQEDILGAERMLQELKQYRLRVELLQTLAIKLANTNHLQASTYFLQAIQEAETIQALGWRSKKLAEVANALVQVGYSKEAELAFSKAKEAAKAAIDFWLYPNGEPRSNESEAYRWLSEMFAQSGQFTEALNILSSPEASALYRAEELEPFLGMLTNWSDCFNRIEPEMANKTLKASTHIAGWIRPEWNKVSNLL